MNEHRDEEISIPKYVQNMAAFPVITGEEFYGCTVTGPAILILSGTTMTNCKSAEGAGRIIWEVANLQDPVTLVGAIPCVNCMFDDCTFVNIGITAPEPVLTEIKRGWGL